MEGRARTILLVRQRTRRLDRRRGGNYTRGVESIPTRLSHATRTDQWRTLFVMTRAVAAIVGVVLLALRPEAGSDAALALLGLAYAAVTCAAVIRFPGVAGMLWFWVVDVAVSVALIYAAGEWRSPFYLLLLTALVLPSTALPVRRALAFAAGAVACYFGVAIIRGVDWQAIETTPRLESFSEHLAVPILVALLLSYAARLVHKLAVERARSERLAVETERRRIAWDLHDSAKQRLNAANLLLSAVDGNGDGAPLEQARHELRSALVDMDSSIRDEALPSIGDGDIAIAMRRRAEELQHVSGARIDVTGHAPRVPNFIAVHVFRVAQEALLNAVRHAGAEHIEVRFGGDADRLHVMVCDDGTGLPSTLRPGAAGIRSMRNRADALGGELRVSGGDGGRGTLVALHIPLPHTQVLPT